MRIRVGGPLQFLFILTAYTVLGNLFPAMAAPHKQKVGIEAGSYRLAAASGIVIMALTLVGLFFRQHRRAPYGRALLMVLHVVFLGTMLQWF